MAGRRGLDQHIAVFGESGSGKTVLLSSFYGAAQEPGFVSSHPYVILADDSGQGSRLLQMFLRMKDSGRAPLSNHFVGKTYSFTVRMKQRPAVHGAARQEFDSIRMVWHDYPGEWFEESVTAEVAARRVTTFRALLQSDVALLLVDGQRLLDNPGTERAYLKSLIWNVRNGLLALREELLVGGRPLVEFPRIWMLALSKSDLVPELTAGAFKSLLVREAGEEIAQLREAIETLVESKNALSVGEDFLVLSSAKFDDDSIDVGARIGVDLLLPVAAAAPIQRHLRWAREKETTARVGLKLLQSGAGAVSEFLVNAGSLVEKAADGRFRAAGRLISTFGSEVVGELSKLAEKWIAEHNERRDQRHGFLAELLERFQKDLERGEQDGVLVLSRR